MAQKLYEMLREKYPLAPRSLAIYPSEDEMIERIFLNLTTKDAFENIALGSNIITPENIDTIAKEIFDDRKHDFFSEGYDGIEIRFPSDKMDDYSRSYDHHVLSVTSLSRPKFLISVGDGINELNDVQREKYFEFVDRVYGQFLESAKTLK